MLRSQSAAPQKKRCANWSRSWFSDRPIQQWRSKQICVLTDHLSECHDKWTAWRTLLNVSVIGSRSTPLLQTTPLLFWRDKYFLCKVECYSAAALAVFSLEKSLLAERAAVNAEWFRVDKAQRGQREYAVMEKGLNSWKADLHFKKCCCGKVGGGGYIDTAKYHHADSGHICWWQILMLFI